MTRNAYLRLCTKKTLTAADKDALLADGDLEECPGCGGLSAYNWDLAKSGVEHIPTASCFEWTCGHCDRGWMEADSPINHPCYTHADD